MTNEIEIKDLYKWCSVPVNELVGHPGLKIPFRVVADSAKMGEVMAGVLVDEIKDANKEKRVCRAIVPCGPKCWYEPFVSIRTP